MVGRPTRRSGCRSRVRPTRSRPRRSCSRTNPGPDRRRPRPEPLARGSTRRDAETSRGHDPRACHGSRARRAYRAQWSGPVGRGPHGLSWSWLSLLGPGNGKHLTQDRSTPSNRKEGQHSSRPSAAHEAASQGGTVIVWRSADAGSSWSNNSSPGVTTLTVAVCSFVPTMTSRACAPP